MISYNFESDNFLRINIKGEVGLEEILDFLDEFDRFENLPADIKLLYDLTEASLLLQGDDVMVVGQKAEEVTQKYATVKSAFLVTHHRATALSYLFSNLAKQGHTERQIFSSESMALKWLSQ